MKHSHHEGDAAALPDLLLSGSVNKTHLVRKVVVTGVIVNALLMALKLAAGWFGHSDALMADGFHSLNDVAVDIVMLIFVGISYRHPTKRYSYGYGKYETLASLLIACLMIFIATMICVEGVKNIIAYAHGAELEHPDIWTVFAILVAMVSKECLYRYYTAAGIRLDSTALKAAGWHHRLDALSSVATLVGVTCAHFLGEKFRVLDPGVSVLIGVMILFPAIRLLTPSFAELMEHTMPASDNQKARKAILSAEGVEGISDMKTRRSGHSRIFDVTIEVRPGTTVEEGMMITERIEKALAKAFCPHIYVNVSMCPAGKCPKNR